MKMPTHPDLMSAQEDPATTATSPNVTGPADVSPGEGVKAVKLFNRRNEPTRRAWDDMSEIDRAVLLESVRQRREAQEHRRSVIAGLSSSRYPR